MPLKAPPNAAAASTSNDETIANCLYVFDQLTQVYGFSKDAAIQALNNCNGGTAVEEYCNYILENNLGIDQGGPIVPLETCPHLETCVKVSLDQLPKDPNNTQCRGGASKGSSNYKNEYDNDKCPSHENWLCLECGSIFCSRYVNGHALSHWQDSSDHHCVHASLADLSVWCHVCQNYIATRSKDRAGGDSPTVGEIMQRLEELKFQSV